MFLEIVKNIIRLVFFPFMLGSAYWNQVRLNISILHGMIYIRPTLSNYGEYRYPKVRPIVRITSFCLSVTTVIRSHMTVRLTAYVLFETRMGQRYALSAKMPNRLKLPNVTLNRFCDQFYTEFMALLY